MILLAHKFHENDKARFDKIAPCYLSWNNLNDEILNSIEIIIANGGEALEDWQYQLPKLKVIFVSAVGYDAIDMEKLRARNIKICNTPNINTDDVADLAMGLLIAGERNIIEADSLIRNNDWQKAEKLVPSFRLRGRILGIYGMGAIGQEIAKRAEPFGLEIIWHGPNPKPELKWEYIKSLDELAIKCDILMVACALNDVTRKSINDEILKKLGKDGVIINIARGGIIDENALLNALKNREILGAGLDVFENEPTNGEIWRGLQNTVLTPHFSGKTRAAREAALLITFDNISRYLKGENLKNQII